MIAHVLQTHDIARPVRRRRDARHGDPVAAFEPEQPADRFGPAALDGDQGLFAFGAALFEFHAAVTEQKRFGLFFGIYNAGIAVTVVMLIVRGIAQVRALELSRAMDAAISGIAGLGHIMTGVGIILYFVMLKKAVAES